MTSTETELVEAPTRCQQCGYPVGIGANGLCKECRPTDAAIEPERPVAERADPDATYRRLEERVKDSEWEALHARWEFGRALLEEREANGGKKLPDGRLAALADALAISRAELKNRMQFAEEYPAAPEVDAALEEFGSWHAICRRGLGDRVAPRPESHTNNVNPDACHIPERLRPRVDPIRAAIGSAYYEDAVEALLDFAESDRKRWERWAKARQSAPRGAA